MLQQFSHKKYSQAGSALQYVTKEFHFGDMLQWFGDAFAAKECVLVGLCEAKVDIATDESFMTLQRLGDSSSTTQYRT